MSRLIGLPVCKKNGCLCGRTVRRHPGGLAGGNEDADPRTWSGLSLPEKPSSKVARGGNGNPANASPASHQVDTHVPRDLSAAGVVSTSPRPFVPSSHPQSSADQLFVVLATPFHRRGV